MTTGDAGRCFWGPNGIMPVYYFAKATTEFRTLAARQAEAILRLRQAEAILLLRAAPADREGQIDSAAAATVLSATMQSAGAAEAVPRSLAAALPGAADVPQAAIAQSFEVLRKLIIEVLKVRRPRMPDNSEPHRTTKWRRQKACDDWNALWLEGCSFTTTETDPSKILVAAWSRKLIMDANNHVA